MRGQVQVSSSSTARVPAKAPIPLVTGTGLDSAAFRQAMVRKLATQGLQNPRVQQAFATVERHRFVDSALVPQAYEDTSLPIGLGQTISKPSVVGRMLELLCEGRTMPMGRVLEIGTGCGYQAALLGLLARRVVSIERVRELHLKARHHLDAVRASLPPRFDVRLVFGDGMLGHAPGGPYDTIIAAAGGQAVPQPWLDQLAPGGRLVAPVDDGRPGQQVLTIIDRLPDGTLQTHRAGAVLFVPLKSGTT